MIVFVAMVFVLGMDLVSTAVLENILLLVLLCVGIVSVTKEAITSYAAVASRLDVSIVIVCCGLLSYLVSICDL